MSDQPADSANRPVQSHAAENSESNDGDAQSPNPRSRPESDTLSSASSETKPSRAVAKIAVLDQLEVEIEKLVAGGDGFGRFDGFTIFVPRSAPGDRVRVAISERRPGFARGEIVELLTAGPGRREAPCAHFGVCGGCDLQHLEDELQSTLKVEATLETLRYLSGRELPTEFETVVGDMWGYRLRTQIHTDRQPQGSDSNSEDAASRETTLRVGYHQRRSQDVVAIDSCPVLVPELEEAVQIASRVVAEQSKPPRRIDLSASADRIATAPPIEGLSQGVLEIDIGEHRYEYDARCFFQGHRGLLAQLVERVVAAKTSDGGSPGEAAPGKGIALDLYAGVGLFTVPLAQQYEQVIAVEGDRIAARYARNNLRKNRCRNAEVQAVAVDSWLASFNESVDRCIVDPPRTGLSKRLVKQLVVRPVRHLTYVSCHPATLARDIKRLGDVYSIDSMTFLDLFPQTGHIEVVMQLSGSGVGAVSRDGEAGDSE